MNKLSPLSEENISRRNSETSSPHTQAPMLIRFMDAPPTLSDRLQHGLQHQSTEEAQQRMDVYLQRLGLGHEAPRMDDRKPTKENVTTSGAIAAEVDPLLVELEKLCRKPQEKDEPRKSRTKTASRSFRA